MYVYIDVKDVNSRYKLFAHKSHRPGTGTRRQQISAQRPDRAIKLLNNFPNFSETIYIYISIYNNSNNNDNNSNNSNNNTKLNFSEKCTTSQLLIHAKHISTSAKYQKDSRNGSSS